MAGIEDGYVRISCGIYVDMADVADLLGVSRGEVEDAIARESLSWLEDDLQEHATDTLARYCHDFHGTGWARRSRRRDGPIPGRCAPSRRGWGTSCWRRSGARGRSRRRS